MLTTPLIRNLAREFGPIDVLIAENQVEVLHGAPFVSELFPVPVKGLNMPIALLKALMKIPAGYEVIVDAGHRHEAKSSMWIAYALGGTIRVGHQRGPHRLYYTVSAPRGSESLHEIDRKLELLAPLGISVSIRKMWSRVSWEPKEEDVRPVVLYLGSRKLSHRTTWDVWRDVIRLCKTWGYSTVFVVGREESLKEFWLEVGRAFGMNVVRCSTVRQLQQIFMDAASVFANNTGPMHLAVAMDVPTVGFFARGNMQRWGYQDCPHAVIELPSARLKENVEEVLRARFGKPSRTLKGLTSCS